MKNGNGAAPGGDCAVGAGNRVLLRSDWEGAELVDYLDPGDFELPGRFSIPLIVEKATNLVIERLESVLVLTTDLVRGQPTDSISHQLLELITIELQRARESALDARAIVALAHDRRVPTQIREPTLSIVLGQKKKARQMTMPTTAPTNQ